MSNIWIISFTALGVIVFLFLVMVATNAYMGLTGKSNGGLDCDPLITKLEATRVERRDRRIELVKQTFGFSQELAEQCAEKLMDLELALYKFLINALQEDSKALAQIGGPVEDIINSCCTATAGMVAQQVPGEDTDALEKKHAAVVNKLKNENDGLRELNSKVKAELEVMKEESQRVMNEYISMYHKEDEKKD